MLREIAPVSFAEQDSQEHECAHRNELSPGGDILRDGSATEANYVDPRDDHD